MIKKIGSLALLVGGILGAIGGFAALGTLYSIGSGAQSGSLTFLGLLEDIKTVMNMAVLGRVGAIIMFISAIVVVAGVFMEGSKKSGAISVGIFGLAAFIGQFMINPITSIEAAQGIVGSDSASDNVIKGLVMIGICGVVLAINGLIILVSKKKNINFIG